MDTKEVESSESISIDKIQEMIKSGTQQLEKFNKLMSMSKTLTDDANNIKENLLR